MMVASQGSEFLWAPGYKEALQGHVLPGPLGYTDVAKVKTFEEGVRCIKNGLMLSLL